MSSYCDFAAGHEVHGPYHDTEYGFPLEDEAGLFERLLLEINQAGLNWELILKKREGFRVAYDGFDVDTRRGHERAQPVDTDDHEGEQDLPPQVGDLEDVQNSVQHVTLPERSDDQSGRPKTPAADHRLVCWL